MEDKKIKLTTEDIIKKIEYLKEQLANYKYHDDIIINMNNECQKNIKDAKLISFIGFLVTLTVAYFIHPYCLFAFFVPSLIALKKEIKALEIGDKISLLKMKDINVVENLKKEISGFEEILEYRKSQEINLSSLRNLNVNLKNVKDVSYDLKEMNSKYISKVLNDIDDAKIAEITNLIIDYLDKDSFVNYKVNGSCNINKLKEKVLEK